MAWGDGADGEYQGRKVLHLSWHEDEAQRRQEGDATLTINGPSLKYTWTYQDEPQTGEIHWPTPNPADVVWIDSWHTAGEPMHLSGTAHDGEVDVKGTYKVPDSPDWGWRIHFGPATPPIRLTMFNISPQGEEEIAVELEFPAPKS
jgi:hypothetical protein